jgi:hypothetical protein
MARQDPSPRVGVLSERRVRPSSICVRKLENRFIPEHFFFGGAPDVDGDGYADVCGRRIEGVWCALNTQSGAFGAVSLWTDAFSNATGWLQTPYGTTLQLGDINGDGMADVCGRGPTGVQCAVARATGPGFERAHV